MTHGEAADEMFAADIVASPGHRAWWKPEPASAKLHMRVTPAMVNGHGIAHGGYLFLFADTAFACACNSHGPVTVASAADISFVNRPARATRSGRRRGAHPLGRSGIYDVTVFRVDGDERISRCRICQRAAALTVARTE